MGEILFTNFNSKMSTKKPISNRKRILQRLIAEDSFPSFHKLIREFWPKVYEVYKRLARFKDKKEG